ncbi:hypothetical protein RSAG8_09336, partial [Rhizoctonia solani AG-8 WAC10335]
MYLFPAYLLESLGLDRLSTALSTATTAPMLASTDILQQVPLVGFLDAYPEPAFILSSNAGPRSSLDFLYGNSSLRELLVGHDESGILDDQTFFSAIVSDEDIVWLSNPTKSGSHSSSRSVGDSHVINLRPTWLPRDHTSVDLELTPTPIDLPIVIPNVGSSSRSYVFTAAPRKAPMSFLRSENHSETRRKRDPGLRLPDFPLMPGAVGPHIRSRMGKSDSSSMLSQSAVMNPAELPTRLVDTFPWETTPLGARESRAEILELMVKYLMETPVSGALFWGWPHQVIIYNDEYAKMIGNKHPRIFGKPGSVAWGELWGVLGAISETVRAGKATCKADDLLFFSTLTELQLPEEFYHSWHWTPVWQEDGTVAGIFNITWETTQKVIVPLDLLFFSTLTELQLPEEFYHSWHWTPVWQEDGTVAGIFNITWGTGTLNVKLTLAGSIGIPDDHPIAPSTIKYALNPLTFRPHLTTLDSGIDIGSPSISDATYRGNLPGSPVGSTSSTNHPPTPSSRSTELDLDLTKVFASGSIELVDPLPVHLAQGLDGRGFKDLPRMAADLALRNPPYVCDTRRDYDADYASWLESVGSGLSNQLTVVLQREADMRMMEERERMDKAKTMFFTNVSHELRTPLTLIQSPLEQLLLSSNINSDTQYKLQLAMRNTRRLKKLIDSIMDMSKLEAGRLVGNFRPVQLSRVTADLAALFRSMAEKKGIDYHIECEASIEPSIYVDIDLWEKIVCNLLSNAFKYTPHGTITLIVRHEATVSHAVIEGVGIPKEYIDQIFDRFFRVSTNTAEGTGVGLSLTKELVSLHGGTMSVQSCTEEEYPGQSGSTFTVTLPHGSSHLPAALIHDAMHPSAHETKPCSLMSGPELLARFREERRTKLIPVIFVTASDDTSLFGGQTDGAVDYIGKPFKVKDLLARAHLQLQLGKRRVKLEEDFEVRSHELQVLTDLSPVGIFRTDAEGRLMYANPAWHQIIGFPLRQDKDEWIDYVCPSNKADILYIWRACFESQKSSSKRVQWKNGCWTHVAVSPLVSPGGAMLGAFGAITDINEQHRAEEVRIALAEEREHLAATRAEEAEAQRQLEVERRRAQELLIDVTSHELRQPVSAIIQNAEVVRTNMKGLRDILHDCQRRKTPYSPTEHLLTELEDDLQAMDSITQCGLAQARIANDVLSLSRIQLNVLSIIPSDFDIRRETSQILIVFKNELMTYMDCRSIMKNIEFELDLGRGADMYGLQTVTTDRSRYAQIITNLMSNAIRFTDTSTGLRVIKVSLELSFDPPSDDSCAVPPLLPKRVVRLKSGSEELDVYIYVSVQDSGPGLQKEDLALLFQRFQQGSNAHHVFGGSGLGLFVCRQLCHMMGGRIEVVSEPGQGATFRFFIRATAPGHVISGPSVVGPRLKRSTSVQSKASKASRASRTSKASGGSGSRPLPETPNQRYNHPLHILITEDNKINQAVLAYSADEACRVHVFIGIHWVEALQTLEQTEARGGPKFDVILV